MSLYRETGRFTVPLELVKTSISREHGDPVRTGDEATWSIRTGIIHRYTLTIDERAGTFTTSIDTKVPYSGLVVLSTIGVFCSLLTGVGIGVLVPLALWNFVLALAPIAPVLPFLPIGSIPLDNEFELHERHPTRYGILPVVAGFTCQMAIFDSLILGSFVGLLGAISVMVYAYRVGILTPTLSEQFTVVAIPAAGAIPLLLTLGNVLALQHLVPSLSNTMQIGVITTICANTVVLLWAYGRACERGLTVIESIPISPLQTRTARLFWTVAYGFLLSALCAMAATVVFEVVPTPIGPLVGLTLDNEIVTVVARPFLDVNGPLRTLLVGGILLAVLSPAALLLGTWAVHLVSTVLSLTRLVRRLTVVSPEELGFDPEATVYRIQCPTPIAYALQLPFVEPGILLGSQTIEELERDELRAICAHERHHLTRNDSTFVLLSTILGLLLGGRNVLLAFYDYPKAEADADKYAARTVGTEPLICALRQMESLQRTRSVPDQGSVAAAAFQHGRWSGPAVPSLSRVLGWGRLRWLRTLIWGPYRLLYGDALMDAAHRSVDERVRTVLEE